MCDDLVDVCPTAISALVLQLYKQETDQWGEFDTLKLLQWWTKKIYAPDEQDAWLNTSLWRQLARHIHALVAVNVGCIANAVAYDLGIESPLIPKPEIIHNPDGTTAEFWSSTEAYGQSLPPFGFETWQRPLRLTAKYPYSKECGQDDDLDDETPHVDREAAADLAHEPQPVRM